LVHVNRTIGFDNGVIGYDIIRFESRRLGRMNVAVRFSVEEELKALPILLRHSPGTVLADRTYIIDVTAIEALRAAGIVFHEVQPRLNLPVVEDFSIGERI
jgi:hypothetical protein